MQARRYPCFLAGIARLSAATFWSLSEWEQLAAGLTRPKSVWRWEKVQERVLPAIRDSVCRCQHPRINLEVPRKDTTRRHVGCLCKCQRGPFRGITQSPRSGRADGKSARPYLLKLSFFAACALEAWTVLDDNGVGIVWDQKKIRSNPRAVRYRPAVDSTD
jgi:hypothetical protein